MRKLIPMLTIATTVALTTPMFSEAQYGARDVFVPKTAAEQVVYECAKASGADVTGKRPMTTKEMRDTTACVDLIRAALAKTK